MAADTPHLNYIPIRHPDGAQTNMINIEAFYTMYLGCIVGNDASTFETLSTLDWRVRYKGSVIGGPPWQLLPEGDAGITAGYAVKSNRIPMVTGDTFNRCKRFRRAMP
jgi:hypothetical protein